MSKLIKLVETFDIKQGLTKLELCYGTLVLSLQRERDHSEARYINKRLIWRHNIS